VADAEEASLSVGVADASPFRERIWTHGFAAPPLERWGAGEGAERPGHARMRLKKYRFDADQTLRAIVIRRRLVLWRY
jgi:hypothetical protein